MNADPASTVCLKGFCYVNDLVPAVLELLKYHALRLYMDSNSPWGMGAEVP